MWAARSSERPLRECNGRFSQLLADFQFNTRGRARTPGGLPQSRCLSTVLQVHRWFAANASLLEWRFRLQGRDAKWRARRAVPTYPAAARPFPRIRQRLLSQSQIWSRSGLVGPATENSDHAGSARRSVRRHPHQPCTAGQSLPGSTPTSQGTGPCSGASFGSGSGTPGAR